MVGTERFGTVVTLIRFPSMHQGDLMQMAPTGKQVSRRGAFIGYHFVSRAGHWLLTDVCIVWDHLDLMRQLGLPV